MRIIGIIGITVTATATAIKIWEKTISAKTSKRVFSSI